MDYIQNESRKQLNKLLINLAEQVERLDTKQSNAHDVLYWLMKTCVPPDMMIPTTWHIDDIRGSFPDEMSDEQLCDILEQDFSQDISHASVVEGNEVIDMNADDILNRYMLTFKVEYLDEETQPKDIKLEAVNRLHAENQFKLFAKERYEEFIVTNIEEV